MRIEKLIENYLERTYIYRSTGTYQYYVKVSRSILKALNHLNIKYIHELNSSTQTDIVLYYKNHTKKKNSQINADISFLYTVLNYNNIEHNLTKFEKLPDDTTSFRAVNDESLKNLVSYLNSLDIKESNNLSWVLSIFLFLETGVRMQELLNIKTINVDLETKSIILDETKNKKKRVVFFDVLSEKLIKEAIKKDNEYLIWNYNKNVKMNRAALFYFFNKIDANIQSDSKITAHRLRKTFATRLLKAGCPITTIQKLLGHTNIRMTMKYLEIDAAMIEKDYFTFYPYKDFK